MSHATVYHLLVARESEIGHALGALGLAHAASECVVTFFTLGVPHEAPLFTVLALSV